MALYTFACNPCKTFWDSRIPMGEITDHEEICPLCDEKARRVYNPGMLKVEGGASPTRFSKGYKTTPTHKDPGFEKEFQSIWGDSGIEHPSTGERYEIFDDAGGEGPYTALPSEREAYKRGAKIARERGVIPPKEEQTRAKQEFHRRNLERAKKRKER